MLKGTDYWEISEDTSGKCLAINNRDQIHKIGPRDYNSENAELISNSFSQFNGNTLLGPGYFKYFETWARNEENICAKYLIKKGWA